MLIDEEELETWENNEPYIDTYFEYIVNCGCKVGRWADREKYGFPLDDEDIADRQELIDLLSEPLRHGIFKDCILREIFQEIQ